MPDNLARQINRRTKPVIMVRSILGESVHATRAGLIKSGIEALNFRVVRTSKPITGMGTPQVVQGVKNCVVDGVIIMVNELTYIICCAVGISWNPLLINAYTVKETGLENVHS